MGFMVNPWGAAMADFLFLATDLVGAPLPPVLVDNVGLNFELLVMDFLAWPA